MRPRAAILILFAALPLLAPVTRGQDIQKYLAEGDEFAEKVHDNHKALERYQKAEAIDANSYPVLWRISRAWVDIAEHMPSDNDKQKDDQLAGYDKGLQYAERAVKANPSGMMGYLRRAVAKGRIALFKGVFSVIGLVKDVKADVEKSISLNNENRHQLAVAHYLLGRTHDKVCDKPYLVRLPLGLGWGDRDDAAAEYEKAISLEPDFIMFRFDAAKNYVEMDEFQKAKDHLARIQQLPLDDEDDRQLKKDAAQLLSQIRNR